MDELEIVDKRQLEMREFGEAFVPDRVLIELPLDKEGQHPAEAAINWLTRQNPTYSFSTVYDPKAGGAKVYWRPLVIGNQ